MPEDCPPEIVYIPTNDESIPCPDGLYSTDCIVQQAAIVYLGLPINSTQSQINTALVSAIIAKQQLITALTLRVEALET